MVQVWDILQLVRRFRASLSRNGYPNVACGRQKARGLPRAFRRNRRIYRSEKFPVAVATLAGRAVAVIFMAPAIDHLGEIAAEPWPAPIFAIGHDIAAVGAVAPFVTFADAAMEA